MGCLSEAEIKAMMEIKNMTEKCRCGVYASLVAFLDCSQHFLCSRGHINQTAQTTLVEHS
jgi:hypothetical protein